MQNIINSVNSLNVFLTPYKMTEKTNWLKGGVPLYFVSTASRLSFARKSAQKNAAQKLSERAAYFTEDLSVISDCVLLKGETASLYPVYAMRQ